PSRVSSLRTCGPGKRSMKIERAFSFLRVVVKSWPNSVRQNADRVCPGGEMVPPFATRPVRSRPIETAGPGNAEHQFGERKKAPFRRMAFPGFAPDILSLRR